MSDRFPNPLNRRFHNKNERKLFKKNNSANYVGRPQQSNMESCPFNRKPNRGKFLKNMNDGNQMRATGRSDFNRNCESQEKQRISDPRWLEMAKKVITKRFNVESKYLDLSGLSNDPDLANSVIPMNISSQSDVGAIFRVVSMVTSEVVNLNLGGNDITNLGSISHFLRRHKGIIRINLADNNISSLVQLRKIGFLKLEELILRNNPIMGVLKQNYVRDLIDLFSTLKSLDNQLLPQRQTHVINKGIQLPDPQMICCSNMAFAEALGKFINKYFSFIDAGNVRALGDAYDVDAVVTMSANTYRCKGLIPETYVQNSRNLKFFAPDDRRIESLTFRGRARIIDLLSKLPQSKHTAVTFDMNVEEASYAVFTVTGDVYDIITDFTFLFMRTYCVVPNNENGFSIINEQITVCKLPYKKIITATLDSANANQQSLPPSLAALTTPEINIVSEFSNKTGMILTFAHECLVGNKWDVTRAMADFNNLKAYNRIPKEAFIQ